ncbi:MAG: 30S ribosomal protein S16 [Verrucomicrobia bacterium]|nr:30S ribosomal protein S16 [Verrucomicrobiota bacterium]
MVVLRLRREGTKNRPFYRIVAADQRFPRDGRFLEILGTYDPLMADNNVKVNLDKANKWISLGAQPSETVRSLLKKAEKALAKA